MISPTTATQPVQERIIDATCQYFNITQDELKLKGGHEAAYRKKVCSFLLRENCEMTFQKISLRLGYQQRKTIHTQVEEIRIRKNISPQIRHDIKNISFLAGI